MLSAMPISPKLWILAGLALALLGLAIATGQQKPGAARRTLARLGATAFFAFLVSFFLLSPELAQLVKHVLGRDASQLGERSGFLTGLAIFFSIGGLVSAWKAFAGRKGGESGGAHATH